MTDPVMLLSQVHGEGRVTFRALRSAGFATLSSVAEAPVQTLSEQAHLSMQTARRLKAGAEDMIGKGIGLQGPPEPEASQRRGRAGRAARGGNGGAREESGLSRFSEGVSLEEAALLGQGIEVLLFEESIFEDDDVESDPHLLAAVDLMPTTPSSHAPAIAAAAELAASLPRVADGGHPADLVAAPPAIEPRESARDARSNGSRPEDADPGERARQIATRSFWIFG